jgi:cyanate lyase
MTTCDDVTAAILAAKRSKGLSWSEIAAAVGRSKEWTTAACLGQMSLDAAQAEAIRSLLELDDEAARTLQEPPYRGSLPTAVPSDPLIYRFYEIVNVYGTTFKALIQEEFGDGIMSAIDFSSSLAAAPPRFADPRRGPSRGPADHRRAKKVPLDQVGRAF